MILRYILIIGIITNFVFTTFGQCNKAKFYDKKDLGEFDYRGQSSFASLSPGDSAKVNIVLYPNQSYRILVGADPKLGSISYRIIKVNRKLEKTLEGVTIKSQSSTNTGALESSSSNSAESYDNFQVDISSSQTKQEPVYDTVWGHRALITKDVVFDNSDGSKKYFEDSPAKAARYIIELLIPEGNKDTKGCINILVGHKPNASKRFKKF